MEYARVIGYQRANIYGKTRNIGISCGDVPPGLTMFSVYSRHCPQRFKVDDYYGGLFIEVALICGVATQRPG